MDFKHLRSFIAYAQGKNLSQAAAGLKISKSVLWNHIDHLETELGTPLFQRAGKKITLNQTGQRFLETAVRIESLIDECAASLKEYKKGTVSTARLRVGAFPLVSPYRTVDILFQFKNAHPEMEFQFFWEDEKKLEAMLDARELDCAFLRNWSGLGARYMAQLIYRDEACIILPTQHPLAGLDAVTWGQLRNETFLLLEGGVTCTECCQRCEREGFRPIIGGMFAQAEAVLRIVEQGMGITFMLRRPSEQIVPPNVVIKSLEPRSHMNIYLACLRKYEISNATRMFWQYVETWKGHIGGV